ncbi:MAG: GlsB/YeaQ/YmgE family stress response membrane protein [Patescibacteria group bacterium]
MGILVWIIFGALTGWIASMIMRTEGGLVSSIVLGIVGAIIGGVVMRLLGQGGVGGFNLYSILVAVLGACILIAVVRSIRSNKPNTP